MQLAFWRKRAASPLGETYTKRKRTMLGRGVFGMFKSSEVDANDSWSATPISPDSFITRRQMSLVARSREQWSNNDYVRSFMRLVRQNVVGPQGVTMQSKATTARGKLDKELNAAHEALWEDFCKRGNCEVTGQLSMRALCNLVMETTARDGEFFARKIYGEDAGAFGFALQMIDPQRLPVWYENYQRNQDGGFIRHGIEFNRYGRPVAYHFASTDEWDAYYYAYAGQGFVRIPAGEIIHGFLHELVGQRRGLPWASTSLFRLHHLQGFEDAAVQNARAGATKMGFIQYKEGFGPEAEDDSDIGASINAEPLSFHELPEGAEFKEFSPQYPNNEFAPFHKAMLRGAAAGMGVLYNNMAGDLEGVNFSSIRQGTLDEREHWKDLQQYLVEEFLDIVHSDWIKLQLLRGALKVKSKPVPATRLLDCRKITFQGRRWQWIDPRADVDGALSSIRGGLTSFSQVIREQGRDPEAVFAEFAADIEAMKAAGISEETIMTFLLGREPMPEPPEPAKPADKKGEAE
jgi:lambda family phage portal protein